MIASRKEKDPKEAHDEKKPVQSDAVRRCGARGRRAGPPDGHEPFSARQPEYVSVPTPERRWNDIFEAIEELMTPTRELVPFFAPGSSTMSLKSSLSYKYRPTVKYEVDLSSGDAQTMGSLNIVFRTQSAALISAMTSFFRLWVQIEDKCLAPLLGSSISCALYDGRFVRPLAMPRGKALTADDVAGAISAYVQLFDRLLKGYLDGSLSASDVEMAYRGDLRSRTLLI